MHAGVLVLHAADQRVRQGRSFVQDGPDQLVLGRVMGVEPVEMEADVLRHRRHAPGRTGGEHGLAGLLETAPDEAVDEGHLPGVRGD